MQIIRSTDDNFDQVIDGLVQRPAFDREIQDSVRDILDDVRDQGDSALCRYAEKYDSVNLTPSDFRVTDNELAEAADKISPQTAEAIKRTHQQIREFSSRQLPEPWSYSPRPGVIVGERFRPLERVGVYVPGGTAPLVSTVIHTVTLAKAAGVPEIALVTPPDKDKNIHPALLYAAAETGATEIYRLGGVYAIGALAYGTETVNKTDKIVGPGNAYVTAAKKEIYGHAALDLVAGPSEVMIIADESARADFVAADILSQIEHGSGKENAVLVTDSDDLITEVQRELEEQKSQLKRNECLEQGFKEGIYLIKVEELKTAVDIASRYAPEHLEIMARRPGTLAKKVSAAGAIFLGPWSPEPVGDFVAGPSHVLPTGGSARFFSGLTADQFCRRISVVNYQKNALRNELETITEIANAEGLDAHAKSASIRFTDK